MPLLIRPPPAIDEGLRAYVCRLATLNIAPTLFRPMLDSMCTATNAVPDLVGLTGESRDALLRRGSVVKAGRRQAGGVRFGDIVLPRKVVRTQGRSVCPMCIAEGGVSRCVWELLSYDVCHRHGLRLVDDCSACQKPLLWSPPSADRCACGYPLAQLEARTGQSGQRKLCKILAASMLRTIHGGPVLADAGTTVALPIDWTLVLCEVIAGVVIPMFSEQHGLNGLAKFHAARHALMASMLEDRTYRDYLRDAVFMYAMSDPLTLVSTLRPGRLREWRHSRFDPDLSELSFHPSLWDIRLVVQPCKGSRRTSDSIVEKSDCSPVIRKRVEAKTKKFRPLGQVRVKTKRQSPLVQEAVSCLSAVRREVPLPRWQPAEKREDVALAAML